jgi:hypothetical protein
VTSEALLPRIISPANTHKIFEAGHQILKLLDGRVEELSSIGDEESRS